MKTFKDIEFKPNPMGEAMNDVVKLRNKHIERVAEGASILDNINWN
jgi:hypothetical protein